MPKAGLMNNLGLFSEQSEVRIILTKSMKTWIVYVNFCERPFVVILLFFHLSHGIVVSCIAGTFSVFWNKASKQEPF